MIDAIYYPAGPISEELIGMPNSQQEDRAND